MPALSAAPIIKLFVFGEIGLLTGKVGAAAFPELFSKSIPTAATLSFISSAIFALSNCVDCFSSDVTALAVLELAAPAFSPPFFVVFSDWFRLARYRGKGLAIGLPFFYADELLLVLEFGASAAA